MPAQTVSCDPLRALRLSKIRRRVLLCLHRNERLSVHGFSYRVVLGDLLGGGLFGLPRIRRRRAQLLLRLHSLSRGGIAGLVELPPRSVVARSVEALLFFPQSTDLAECGLVPHLLLRALLPPLDALRSFSNVVGASGLRSDQHFLPRRRE